MLVFTKLQIQLTVKFILVALLILKEDGKTIDKL